jgi:hypothetical protein
MELLATPLGLHNKLGEEVEVEAEYVYPLLKGSDLFHWQGFPITRGVILPQRRLGADTRHLANTAPRLWGYLERHSEVFARRKSSIYMHQPPYSIFGIGAYSFAPYKVAVSGLHKTPRFRAIGPQAGRPVMFDDTCYFIPCWDARQAALLATLLNHEVTQRLIAAISFPDAKRPITKSVLERVDLGVVLELADKNELLRSASSLASQLGGWGVDMVPWPEHLSDLLTEAVPAGRKKQGMVTAESQLVLALT